MVGIETRTAFQFEFQHSSELGTVFQLQFQLGPGSGTLFEFKYPYWVEIGTIFQFQFKLQTKSELFFSSSTNLELFYAPEPDDSKLDLVKTLYSEFRRQACLWMAPV